MKVAIIQARMGAKRLPGKLLKELSGIPLLKFQNQRLTKAKIDKIVIATSLSGADDAIANFCRENSISCFRGSENDVLSRYYECAKEHKATIIIRVTGDCPLVDPKVIDETVSLLEAEQADFAANTVPPDKSYFPDGSDVEVFTFEALERAHQECKDKHDREHVTFYFWKYNNGFKTAQLTNDKNYSKYRFTVDYPQDLEVMDFLIKELDKRGQFGHLEEVAKVLDDNPQIKEKNSGYYFGIGWEQ